MRLFLIKILLFTILLTVSAFVFDNILKKGYRKSNATDIQEWNAIFDSKINSDVIINGSSRAFVQISPQILDSLLNVNSYNFGMDGYPFNMQYVRYKIYEKYNKKPRLIIQIADLNTLQRRTTPYSESQFFPYLHEPLLANELKKMEEFSSLNFYIPAFCYHSDFGHIFIGLVEFFDIKHIRNDKYKGYLGQNRKWNATDLEKVLSGDSLVSEINPEIVQEFDSLLNHCQENNIQVVMVFPPEYIKATEFTKNKQEVIDIYRSFSKKYDFPFLDYSTDSLCYDTTYFYNAMHLNKTGAEIFSTKLAHDIGSLGILKKNF